MECPVCQKEIEQGERVVFSGVLRGETIFQDPTHACCLRFAPMGAAFYDEEGYWDAQRRVLREWQEAK